MSDPDNSHRSLAPFLFGSGIAVGVAIASLAHNPGILQYLNPAIIMGDVTVYTFFVWLFWPDFKAQWKVRLNKIRGQIGFRWQADASKAKFKGL